MITTANWLIRLYCRSLLLFPARFQAEYGEEMKAVFSEACQEAANRSAGSVWLLALRELRDLPTNLAREHLAELKGGSMTVRSRSPESFPRAAIHGALVFGISFAFVFLAFCLLDVLLNAGKPFLGANSILVGHWIYGEALACGLGTAWLSMRTNIRRAWAAGITITIGMYILWRLEMFVPFFRNVSSIQVTSLRLLSAFLPMVINGLIVGGLLAWSQFRGKDWHWYGLAGTLGFCLGLLALAFPVSAFLSQGQAFVTIGSFWYFAYELLPMIPFGLVIGACLGLKMGSRGEKASLTVAE